MSALDTSYTQVNENGCGGVQGCDIEKASEMQYDVSHPDVSIELHECDGTDKYDKRAGRNQ